MFNKNKPINANRQIRKEQRKREFKRKVNETWEWIKDNKEILVIVVPAALALTKEGAKLIKCLSRNVALIQEKRIKDLKIYDRSMGRYLDLKRPLNQNDMKVVLERRDNGEKLSNILMDLDLLK